MQAKETDRVELLVALDLSLACTGIVAARLDWGGRWDHVVSNTCSAQVLPKLKKGEKREMSDRARFQRIAAHACNICDRVTGAFRGLVSDRSQARCVVLIEHRLAGAAKFDVHGNTAELHSLVKCQLNLSGYDWELVHLSTARKLICGKVPRRGDDAKNLVQASFRAAGCPVDWNQDQTDAMAILNHGMSERGGFFYGVTAT